MTYATYSYMVPAPNYCMLKMSSGASTGALSYIKILYSTGLVSHCSTVAVVSILDINAAHFITGLRKRSSIRESSRLGTGVTQLWYEKEPYTLIRAMIQLLYDMKLMIYELYGYNSEAQQNKHCKVQSRLPLSARL